MTKKTVKKKVVSKKSNKKIGIVVSRFNEFITQRLLDGCLKELSAQGVKKKDITVAWVPGAFEIPVTALRFAKKRSIDAVICLGAVIKGETIHFELVAEGAALGISKVSLVTGKPVIFGVVATDTVNQAYARSEEDGDNKGSDAAQAAVEMIDTLSLI